MTSSSPRTEILHCVQNDRVKGPSHDQCCLDFFPLDTRHPGSVSQHIGKPFNGQAKGLLWLTWRSYAGPPQYFIPPEGGRPEPVREASAGPGQNPGSPGPKGPAAGSTLTPVRACQPSGILESTAPVPAPIPPASQAPEPLSPTGAGPYEVSVTGFTFRIIWHDNHPADWLAALAPLVAAPPKAAE